MKVITHTITHTAKFAGGQIESIMYTANFAVGQIEPIMYPAKFAGGRSRLDLLLPSFLPSREEKKIQDQKNHPLGCRAQKHMPPKHLGRDEKKIQDRKNHPLGCRGVSHTPSKHLGRDEQKIQNRIFCPLRGHAVGRMRYAPTAYRQETLFPINSRKERTETKMQKQKNRPLGSRGVLHTPHTDCERIETKKQDRIFCPLRGHAVGRMQYAPTSYRQETLFPINSREERIETKIQEQKNRPLGSRGVLHTPYKHLGRDEQKKQDRIFCPLRGHSVGRMQYAPTDCRQETLYLINSQEERIGTKMQEQKNRPLGSRGVLHTPHMNRVRTETKMQERIKQSIDSSAEWHNPHMDFERTETKMQERIKQSIDSGAEWHTPFMRHGERDAVWRDTFLEQRARVAIWRDRRLEEKSSHESLQMRISGENSKPYKSSLVALSEQLRDIFAA